MQHRHCAPSSDTLFSAYDMFRVGNDVFTVCCALYNYATLTKYCMCVFLHKVCVCVCSHVFCLCSLPSPCRERVFTQCLDWLYPDWPRHAGSEPSPTSALSALQRACSLCLHLSKQTHTYTHMQSHASISTQTHTYTHLKHLTARLLSVSRSFILSNSSTLCHHI